MKNKILLASMLCAITCGQIFSKTNTNKTFMTPRPQLSNMAMEYTTWHMQINKLKGFSPSFQLTGFYQDSTDKKDIGQYFGYYASNAEEIRDYISVATEDEVVTNETKPDSINDKYIFHLYNADGNAAGDLKFNASQEIWGLRIDYYQSLNRFFLQAAMPIVSVKNKMNPSAINTLVPFENAGDSRNNQTILDYLNGNVSSAIDTHNAQQALTNAKIVDSKSTSGVADIDVALGYNIFKHKHNRVALKLDLVIPTGNKAKGQYIFEPICGNGHYWAFGGGLVSTCRLWQQENDSIQFLLNADLKYLFRTTQKRTLGLIADNGSKINFGQYYLGGKAGESVLFPLANVLTRDIRITPGLEFEGMAAFAFNTKNFTLDLGYNIFARQGENASLNGWENDTYAIAATDFDTTGNFAAANIDPTYIKDYIARSNLDLETLKTPTQITHKFYAGLGYAFNQCRFPVILGLGSSYEFSSNNGAIENWAVWGKLGISF
ncbi:hypothetical protein K9M16_03830 [Candidatus Babeliales bacterium]|nr:hypothetical protein [Candidatus Babeliales bacterium]